MGSPEPDAADRVRRQYSFGEFTLDLDGGFLRRGAEEVPLRPKPFEVLVYLVEHHGRLATKGELTEAVWPGTAVMDNSLAQCLVEIRRALGDDSQQLIRTVARRGYVFTAPVTTPVVEFPRLPASTEAERRPLPLTPEPETGRLQQRHVTIGAFVSLVIIAIALALGWRTRTGEQQLVYTRLTNFADAATSPALSPDGRMLAFIRGESTLNGPRQIYIKLLPDGEPVRLTDDNLNKQSPKFSPDGALITYGALNPALGWDTWVVPVLGGQTRPFLANASGLTWIAAGAGQPRLLFSELTGHGSQMAIVSSTESRTGHRTIYLPPEIGMAHRSYLSPDRKQVLVVEMGFGGAWLPCRLTPFDGNSRGKPVGPVPAQCTDAAWSPNGKWMYFSVNTGGGFHIWRQRVPDGTPEQVTFGVTEEEGIEFSPDGRSIVTSIGSRQSTVWVHDSRGNRQITSEGYGFLPSVSPDGSKLYYLVGAKGARDIVSGELWVADLGSGQRQRLLPDFLMQHYAISSDGERVVFVVPDDAGRSHVWLAALNGRSAPGRVTAQDGAKAFFGAGSEVVFAGEGKGAQVIYRVKEDGSELQKVVSTSNGSKFSAW